MTIKMYWFVWQCTHDKSTLYEDAIVLKNSSAMLLKMYSGLNLE